MSSARRRRWLPALALAPCLVASCSILVPNEVPDYQCIGSDPSSCPSGFVCDAVSLLCVTPAALVEGGPDVEQRPDAGSGDATNDREKPGPADVGGNCVLDTDCKTGLLCGTSTILTTAIVPTTSQPICTKPCCTSADCDAGFICFAGGTGGNYCVAAGKAERPAPSTGGKAPGESCATAADCRSALCAATKCVDTCCQATNCAAGTTCRVTSGQDHIAWACAAPNGGAAKDLAAPCVDNVECKNDNCVTGTFPQKRCTPPCCSASDCAALGFANNVCAYGAGGNDQLKWCFVPNVGGVPLGAACNANNDCQSRYCDSELGTCASACCTTADCPTGQECRPSAVNTPFLRCVKR